MEDLRPLMNSIFTRLFKAGTLKQAGDIREAYSDLDPREKQARDEEIERIFDFHLPQQFVAIDQLIESDRALPAGHVPSSAPRDTYQRNMDYAKETYDAFMADQTKKTREGLRHATGLLHGALGFHPLLVLNAQGVQKYLNVSHITNGGAPIDPETFKLNLPKLFQAFARIYLMNIVNHYYHSEDSMNLEGHRDAEHQSLRFLKRLYETTVWAAEVKYHEMRLGFLMRTCGDEKHEHHCGAESDRECTELGAKIYRTIREDDGKLSNNILAARMASSLRKHYPHFLWTVVVQDEDTDRDTHRRVEVQYNVAKYKDNGLWLQYFGTERHSWLESRERRNKVESYGVGDYGCFVCYRTRQRSGKMAVVLWADKRVTEAPRLEMTLAEAQLKWDSTQHERVKITEAEAEEGNVSLKAGRAAADLLTHHGTKFAFAVVVVAHTAERSDKTVGIDVASHSGMKYPMCFKDDYHCVLFWPEDELGTTDASQGDGLQEVLHRKFK